MVLGRIFGWLLILGAFLVAVGEVYAWLDQGSYHITAAGQLWYELDRGSLNFTQAIVQRYIHPALWDDVIRPLLLLPAWLVLGGVGILLLFGFKRHPRRRRHSSSFS